ncbi:Polypyrimidine tract-binding protein 1 [Nymphon striatum]|nr:Polypyrimidine tract-binding protein 1 [Nymphon striatum]
MRGSDELLSHTPENSNVSNGTIMNDQNSHHENNNDAKKAKLDKSQAVKPSRVIHLRNIPNEVTETEIIQLGMPFGRVTNVLVLKGKNQAFLEMAEEASASEMVKYFLQSNAQIRGRSVYVQYSNHKELKTDSSHSNAFVSFKHGVMLPVVFSQQTSTQAALQAAQAFIGHQSSQNSGNSDTQGGPNTVLRVIVEQMLYPVTLDILYQSNANIKTLNLGTFQALIQYPDVLTAQTAKMSLDGQNVYNSCCTLRIDYSKLTNLNVKYNNDKSRDYTNPTLLSGDPALDNGLPYGGLVQSGGGIIGGASNPFAAVAAMHGLGNIPHPLATAYGSSLGVNLGGFGIHGSMGHHGGSSALGAAGILLPGQMPQVSSVLLISNLNEEKILGYRIRISDGGSRKRGKPKKGGVDDIGVYGDVLRVKILFNKKDNALIQMAEPTQAQLALQHLDKVRLFGRQIRVSPSKHKSVQLPKEGQPDAGLTKDFNNSPLHRFKKPGSKNYQNIYAPSATLHLSNIPPNVTEQEIVDAFSNTTGEPVEAFKFFPKDKKMALIQMRSIEDAIIALICLRQHEVNAKATHYQLETLVKSSSLFYVPQNQTVSN